MGMRGGWYDAVRGAGDLTWSGLVPVIGGDVDRTGPYWSGVDWTGICGAGWVPDG